MCNAAPMEPVRLEKQQPGLFYQDSTDMPHKNNGLPGLFNIYSEAGPGRTRAQEYIHAQFARYYGANVKQYMPYLLTLEKHGEILAALGFRLAAGHGLFLEQYLTEPVERLVSKVTGNPVKRDLIVEIGNLASSHPERTKELFALLTFLLKQRGCEWVVCNTTPKVRSTFKHMGFEFVTLQKTTSTSLQQDAHVWGSYYDHDPRLCMGSLSTAAQKILAMNQLPLASVLQQVHSLTASLRHGLVAA